MVRGSIRGLRQGPRSLAQQDVQRERRRRVRVKSKRLPGRRHGLLVSVQPIKNIAPGRVDRHINGSALNQTIIQVEGLSELLPHVKQLGQIAEDAQVPRRKHQSAAQGRFRLVRPIPSLEQDAQVGHGAALVRSDLHGPTEMAFRLVEVFQMAQRHAQVNERIMRIRPLLHGDAGRGNRLLRTIQSNQRLGKIEVRPGRLRIMSNDVTKERDFIAVNSRLPPRQRPQDQQDDHGETPCGVAPPVRQPAGHEGRGPDDDRGQSDAGQVLVAVRHEREQHIRVVHEAERRRQRHGEEQRAGQRPPPNPMPQTPEQPDQRRRGRQPCPPGQVPDPNVPMRIDNGEIRGIQQLAHVEPERARRDEHPLNHRIPERRRRRRRDHPQVNPDQAQGHDKKRRQSQQITGRHPAVPPPVQNHQRRRQSDHHVFRQRARRQQHQGQAVTPPARLFQKTRPSQDAGQIKQAGEHVFALNRPGHGFDVQRMHRKDRGDDPGPRDRQPPQQPPQQHRIRHVQQHVDHVIPGRGEPPQLMLQPETGIRHGPVMRLLNLARHEPDAPKPRPVPDSRLPRNVVNVVPDEATPQHRRQIADGHQQRKRQDAQRVPVPHREPRRGCRRRCGRRVRLRVIPR